MPAPAAAAAAAPLIKGLLGAGARGAATGGARAAVGNAAKGMAADAVKGGAKEGMKNFARNMTGKTSDDYKSRVDGVNPETGEYLTPEERKARFKGFATGVKPGSQKLLSAAPTQTVAALPPAPGVGAGADDPEQKTVNHLEKIQMYLEKLLKIEESALARLQDRVLSEARKDNKEAAAAEEAGMEKGKGKKEKKGKNPIVQGMQKKAKGIFQFLMDFGMKFVGYKILEWIGKPENQEKVTNMIEFFKGIVSFIGTVGKFIGDGFNFAAETVEKSIEGIKFLAEKIKDFFTFEWLDIDKLLEPLQPIISFFTELIPSAFDSFIDGMAGAVDALDKLPEQFVGIVDKIANGFLGFIGLSPKDTEDFPDNPDGPAPVETGFLENTSGDGSQPKKTAIDDKPVADQAQKNVSDLPEMQRGGYLSGRTHAQGGEVRELEGGEYVFNRRAVAAIGRDKLDSMNFGQYPAVGGTSDRGDSYNRTAATGGLIQKYKEGGPVHPLLTKMNDQNIKKANAPVGRCVTGSLDTMKKSGVPEPAATGLDVGNNPRGGMVQMIKDFGWKSMGGTKTPLDSPYGKVTPGIFTKDQYLKQVEEGKVPSGALVFQTRHPSWTGTSYNSRGYDMAIAQKQGRALWNGVAINDPLVYAGTKKVVVLTPDGKAGDGAAVDMNSDPDNNGKTTTTTTTTTQPKKQTAAEKAQALQGSILNAANTLVELMGGKPVNTEDILKIKQEENIDVKSKLDEVSFADGIDSKIINYEEPSDVTTSFDLDFAVPTLGDNLPPFTQALYPINL